MLLAWSAFAAAAPNPRFELPGDVVPRKYSLELTIDPERPQFSGTVRMELDLRAATRSIVLNAKDLSVSEARLEAGGRTFAAKVRAKGDEFLAVELDRDAGPVEKAVLTLRYRGHLDATSLLGVYRRRVNGRWYVYTTFTPIEARRAFPCFDEPRYKTPWEISIRVPRGEKAFSNGREIAVTEGPGKTTLYRFAETAPLPSELVAFAVGPFDVYDGGMVAGTPIRVLTPEGKAAMGEAGAEATRQVLPRLEAYLGMKYPFGKLDHLSLPEGAFGAVENPGLITYLSKGLLISLGDPGANRELRRLEAHEIGHQWFGDLVTQGSWPDVWLSEGIATWISHKMIDEERPEARRTLEAIEERERIMAVDHFPNRPVRVEMTGRAQSKDTYNLLVYQKAGGVLLMLEGWLGEGKMRDGLRRYLREHAMGNATTEDLGRALREESGADVLPVMKAFLDQAGVPRVRGRIECSEKPVLKLEQVGTSAVPVCYRAGDARSCAVLGGPLKEIALEDRACPAWLYLNAGGTGYYRTEWSAAQLAGLAEQGWTALSAAEKLTLAYDLRAQKAGFAEARGVLMRLAGDREPAVARAAIDALRAVEK